MAATVIVESEEEMVAAEGFETLDPVGVRLVRFVGGLAAVAVVLALVVGVVYLGIAGLAGAVSFAEVPTTGV